MKYVFICDYARNRSPTAVEVCNEIAHSKNLDIEAEAMALFPEESLQYEKKEAERLKRVDKVFVMTDKMKRLVKSRYSISNEKVCVLDIEDEYDCHGLAGPKMKNMLREVLFSKLENLIK